MAARLNENGGTGAGRLAGSLVRSTCFLGLVGLGLVVLQTYLRALVWALVLAVAPWPLFEWTAVRTPARLRTTVLPASFALFVLLGVLVPLVVFGIEAAQQAHALLDYGSQAERNGIPVPEAIGRLPPEFSGPLATWWREHLARSQYAEVLVQNIDADLVDFSKDVVRRVGLFCLAPIALFFLFRDENVLRRQSLVVCRRFYGERGERLLRQIASSILGSVNGLVLVGLGEGAFLGVLYVLVGVPHAVLLAALTGLLAIVPYAGGIAIVIAACALITTGKTVLGVVVLAVGFLTNFSADHIVRPSLIGGSTGMPFIWVLLGILGGLEHFGLLGLFVGPAVMGALVSLWRDVSTDPTNTIVAETHDSTRRPA